MEIGILIIGAIIGFIAGYFFGKTKACQPIDFSQQQGLINNLGTQLAEIKIKFEEVEKSRASIEKEREKTNDERERRIKEWVEGTTKTFVEINEKSAIAVEEKEKRIESWMETTKSFFEEQKKSTENFLVEQDKGRAELEKQRDAQLQDMKRLMESFTRTISGTKTRGMAGEEMLAEVLRNSIQAGIVVKDLKAADGCVEFAWKVDSNKYIPIDAKLPDVFELIGKYDSASDVEDQKSYKKEIIFKIIKEIKNVQKYQNLPNTIDCCMLVVPPAVLEIAPEIISTAKESNVFICTYTDVFTIAYILGEQYIRMKEEGDIGKYRKMIERLFQALGKIYKNIETIERGITIITNAKKDMQDEIAKTKDSAKEIEDLPKSA